MGGTGRVGGGSDGIERLWEATQADGGDLVEGLNGILARIYVVYERGGGNNMI